MEKIDLKKEYKELYKPDSKSIVTATVPEFSFLMIDGKGDPNTSKDFARAIEALFSVAYTMKFMVKKGETGIANIPVTDFAVMPLQGLWWSDNMNDFKDLNKNNWKWTLMILQPDFITKLLLESAREKAMAKKDIPAAEKIRFEKYNEGQVAQIMYIGPYADEGPVIQQIHEYIEQQSGKLSGKHHEIYLSDARRTAPEKLKTVIRQPFEV